MTVPEWVQDSVFYQIFPDRFENGDKSNDPENIFPWGALPSNNSFHGGDLRGIIERLYYLMDLGINAIYLNPIFLSASNHRYNTTDYFQIDPKLGSMNDFHSFLDIAHRNQINVILDGVFNHCGRGFYAFNDILENQSSSPYKDWFHIRRFPIDAYSPGDATTYEAWWKFKSLPKFNTANPAVRQYLMRVARYWIEQGIDGWRLDVPNEIDDDRFWWDFRSTVKSINPEAYLVGEIWDGNKRWVGDSHFDGLMNYPLRTWIVDLLRGEINSEDFVHKVTRHFQQYPVENIYSMYNLLSSHDVERILKVFRGDMRRVKMAYAILFAMPGAPAIYYGDEIGLDGGTDPDCRRTMPWDETLWDADMRFWLKNLVRLRKNLVALRRGELNLTTTEESNTILVVSRKFGNEEVFLLSNPSRESKLVSFNFPASHDGQLLRNLLNSEEFQVTGNKITMEMDPWAVVFLTTRYDQV